MSNPRGTVSKLRQELAKELAKLDGGTSDVFDLPGDLKQELEEKGLVARWINAKQYEANYGQHRSGWQVYKREKNKKMGPLDFSGGSDPDGYVRRMDSVLAVMPKEKFAVLRKRKQLKNAMQADVNEMQAETMREMLRRSGIEGEITEGYDKPV